MDEENRGDPLPAVFDGRRRRKAAFWHNQLDNVQKAGRKERRALPSIKNLLSISFCPWIHPFLASLIHCPLVPTFLSARQPFEGLSRPENDSRCAFSLSPLLYGPYLALCMLQVQLHQDRWERQKLQLMKRMQMVQNVFIDSGSKRFVNPILSVHGGEGIKRGTRLSCSGSIVWLKLLLFLVVWKFWCLTRHLPLTPFKSKCLPHFKDQKTRLNNWSLYSFHFTFPFVLKKHEKYVLVSSHLNNSETISWPFPGRLIRTDIQ